MEPAIIFFVLLLIAGWVTSLVFAVQTLKRLNQDEPMDWEYTGSKFQSTRRFLWTIIIIAGMIVGFSVVGLIIGVM